MEWKLDDSRPIWPQLKEQLIIAIVAGRFQMGVNRNTMQRALSELEHDGFVITNRTAGRTVTTDEGLVARMKEQIAMQNIEKFIREMEAIGYGADDIVKMIQERGVEKK